ncbi:beta-ketoacyl-[acyl-carrier-protein] synthase family protein [Amycolatopsis sp. H20-H5]|uniref:beta-ketoacyl-[acyl-carrier-protein] synthase family protein n=1 Tax=Amycolatopsis sp. H20-H5 TaxID=3046309 RepID=UPI002DB95885|nr:beta-ketoacyl synthase N-terminal-like domain-containing protein [Amycolatopsis sp. H20-H5]MEC3979489.1 beta-ketoacyl synthase N-terminal-like domain-containing protein [Amycolatopsis sp. H20-H5]
MRIPITGVGAVASIGRDSTEVFTSLCAGRSGLGAMRGFDPSRFTAGRLYEIDDRTGPAPDRTLRATGFLLDAVGQAAAGAGLGEDLSGIPVLVGTGLRELRSAELWWRDSAAFGADRLHFGTALRERFGAADTHTISNACSASLYALALGADLLNLGEADTVIVAGVDSITESMFGLADRVQPTPPTAVRTLDANRQGTILGDGAAAVVLRREDLDWPGGRLWGRLRGVGLTCDAKHPTAPDRDWVAATIRQAHAHAGVSPRDIDLVMLHGTGTPLNDLVEAQAYAEVFGEAASGPVMTGIKSMTGHTSGSSSLLSLVVALQVMATGKVPPILGLTDPIPEADGFRLVRDAEAKHEVSLAEVHGFGFGGINAVAIVEAP